ncbi:peptidase S8/S53 domain-containing protein [Cladochytrium replicatum]|nr:peptidase S8/S53 domain-containing protein [Cladochytrium replicatum]
MAQIAYRSWAVRLVHDTERNHPGQSYSVEEAEAFANAQGFVFLGPIGELEGYFLFEAEVVESSLENGQDHEHHAVRKRSVDDVHEELDSNGHVFWYDLQVPKKRFTRSVKYDDLSAFSDPLFPQQWHLNNDGSNGLFPGHDINVVPVWMRDINGTGITVAVLDDGVDFNHPDIKPNFVFENSWDFTARNNKPMPKSEHEGHGTRCAGEIAAVRNDVCGVGVAYGARVSAGRVLANVTTDAIEAQAFNLKLHQNDIFSSSWGPSDDGTSLDGPGYLAQQALSQGALRGRGGFGNIYVFASGNGGLDGDNCNFDGYASSIYTISVGAVDATGKMPQYGERCSAHLVVAYTGGVGPSITTTNFGGGCTNEHSGTSAAAPLVSGVVALILSARKELTWRDIQQLIVETSARTDPHDDSWKVNGANRAVSHKYGFGVIDAGRMLERALEHELLPFALTITSSRTVNAAIPLMRNKAHHFESEDEQMNEGLSDEITLTESDVGGIAKLEHVQVTVRIRHPARRHLTITLTSAMGTQSILAAPRFHDDSDQGFNPWTFMTVHCWGEDPIGKWTLHIHDGREGEINPYTGQPHLHGELLTWQLTLHGVCHADRIVENEDDGSPGFQQKRRMCQQTVNMKLSAQRNTAVAIMMVASVAILVIFGYLAWRLRKSHRSLGGFVYKVLNKPEGSSSEEFDLESPSKPSFEPPPPRPASDFRQYIRNLFARSQPKKRGSTGYGQSSGMKKSWSTDQLTIRSSRSVGNEFVPGKTQESSDSEYDSDEAKPVKSKSGKYSHDKLYPGKTTKMFDKRTAAVQEEKLTMKRSVSSGNLPIYDSHGFGQNGVPRRIQPSERGGSSEINKGRRPTFADAKKQ